MRIFHKIILLLLIASSLAYLPGCSGSPTAPAGTMLHVVATTSIIGDVVSQVGGDMIQLTVLMPVGTDPHDFQPRPQDLARLNDAQIVFANGVGLEPFLSQILVGSGSSTKLVDLSLTLPLLSLPGSTGVSQDPHTWMDPNNVILWTQQIANTLSVADPINEAE